MDTPELITLAAAAKFSERSQKTLKRWLKAGSLTRHEAATSTRGGSPRILIDKAELQTLLIAKGQLPKAWESTTAPVGGGDNGGQWETKLLGHAPPKGVDTGTSLQLQLVELRGALRAAELRAELVESRWSGDLAAARAALEASEATRAALESQLVALRHQVEDLRAERDDWKARHDAREAELKAERTARGLPWWRRLLGTSPAVEADDN
jgi:polyhydroxyalkanoate synthesis regulator phasin